MAKSPIIRVEHVYKSFRLPHERYTGLKQAVLNLGSGKKFEVQHVLKDVSFEVQPGEFFGIVGRNGSGKSTLLKLLAQIYTPSQGDVRVNGSLTPFIELGVGFNPELTGRENVYLNGALLGFDHGQMDEMYDDIVEFAELARFMDQRLKNYSSGMQVRLAFSIAIRAKSDILLLDEVLAVGDSAFQRKCYDYFMNLKQEKTTVILVTHDMSAIRQYCDRAILIEGGKVLDSGPAERIAQDYQQLFTAGPVVNEASVAEKSDRWGNGQIRATKTLITPGKTDITIAVSYEVKQDIKSLITGFTIYGPGGQTILESNTLQQRQKLGKYASGQRFTHIWSVPNIFADGKYTVSVAACDQSTTEFYDWLNKAGTFDIFTGETTSGIVNPPIIFSRSDEGKDN